MASLASILRSRGETLEDRTTLPRVSGKTAQRWSRVATEPVIRWEDLSLGTVLITMTGVQAGQTHYLGGNAWTPITFNKEVGDEVTLHTRVRGKENILVCYAIGKDTFEDRTHKADFPTFHVRVGHKPNGDIHTFDRNRDGQNDFRIDFVDKSSGLVVVLEISFVIRNGSCWICMQETYSGNILCLMGDEVSRFPDDRVITQTVEGVELSATILPNDPIYAHMFANPFTVFNECGKLLKLAIEQNSALSTTEEWPENDWPKWEPKYPQTSLAPKKTMGVRGDWLPAVMAWFNLTLGYGFAVTAEGEAVFVHFNSLRDADGSTPSTNGRMPIVHPMQSVFIKLAPQDKSGRVKAELVCPL